MTLEPTKTSRPMTGEDIWGQQVQIIVTGFITPSETSAETPSPCISLQSAASVLTCTWRSSGDSVLSDGDDHMTSSGGNVCAGSTCCLTSWRPPRFSSTPTTPTNWAMTWAPRPNTGHLTCDDDTHLSSSVSSLSSGASMLRTCSSLGWRTRWRAWPPATDTWCLGPLATGTDLPIMLITCDSVFRHGVLMSPEWRQLRVAGISPEEQLLDWLEHNTRTQVGYCTAITSHHCPHHCHLRLDHLALESTARRRVLMLKSEWMLIAEFDWRLEKKNAHDLYFIWHLLSMAPHHRYFLLSIK